METKMDFRKRCTDFGISVVNVVLETVMQQGKSPLLLQLEKAATSIGANDAEAKSAQSRADFLSKFEIALKEARETDYWLPLLKGTAHINEN
jgi:four helix bundle protein